MMEPGYSNSGRPMQGPPPPGYGRPMQGPPPPGYGRPMQGPPQGPPQGVVANQAQPQVVNVVAGAQNFGTQPVSLTCQFCKNPITTRVEKKCNCCTCCLCCATGLIFFICIQCCRNKEIGCSDATHTCPNCGQILGNYNSC